MSEICVSVLRQIDGPSVSKRCSQFPSSKSGHKYESGRNTDYLFYTYRYCEPQTTRHRGFKNISYSTQLSTKFILLINVEMPTIVGILTFISMMNTTSERLKARNFFICLCFSVYEQLKFHAQLS